MTVKTQQAKMDILKGDTVLVLAGKDKGKRGRVIQAVPKDNKVVVEGVNIVTRHQKPRPTTRGTQQQTGRIQKPAPLNRSKVMLVCPQCDKPTRIAHKLSEGGRWVRSCKKCGEILIKA
jgi:large subunit ribosomal protein L24